MRVGVSAGKPVGRPAHTWWNFVTLGGDIALFYLGLSISSAFTVLPLFVHHLTQNNIAVALIPAIRALGIYGPQLLVASHVERRRHAMPFILVVTTLERVPYLFLAVATLWLAQGHPDLLLILFLLFMFLAVGSGGLTFPAWLDLIARAIPNQWFGRFLGFWSGLGGLLGIGGATIAAWLLAHVAWPLNFALCFALTFGAFIISFALLALGREPERMVRAPPESAGQVDAAEGFAAHLRREARELWALVRGDEGLRRLLVTNVVLGFSTMASALFAVAALRQGGLSDADVGAESTVLFVASTLGNFLWGAVGDRFGHRAVLVWGACGAAASAALALIAHDFLTYGGVFFLLGLNVAAVNLAALTFIAEFGPAARRPTYVALASVAYAPFAIGAPILGGALANAWGYTPVFALSVVTGLAAMALFQLWVPNPRRHAQPKEEESTLTA